MWQTDAENVVQAGAIQPGIRWTFRRRRPIGRSDRIDRWHLGPMASGFLERGDGEAMPCGRAGARGVLDLALE